MTTLHRAERDQLRTNHVAMMRAIKRARYENRPTGLAAFLGKVAGVTLLQKKIHQYQDARRLNADREQLAQLKARQGADGGVPACRERTR
ncbi:MAG TPA: hypothetical protein VGP12_08235 [Nitrosospira sp.]|jgi:hypothetical protein|nr:hypothetical protein [Nitrosospira sp.]